MDDLPLELIIYIFQYLNKKEQIKFSEVSKNFNDAVFSLALWTENEECLKVNASLIKSFTKFLKRVPRIKYLNFQCRPLTFRRRRGLIDVNLPSVLKPLKNLECLSLQLHQCKSLATYFPSTLKHISLWNIDYFLNPKFINDDLLKCLADSCPLLEHIEIESHELAFSPFSRQAIRYLLEKVKDSLQTLILSDLYPGDPVFCFSDCPPNVTTLWFNIYMHKTGVFGQLLDLPNLENLQILALNHDFPLSNEDFYERLCIPKLQILYMSSCNPEIDVLMRFVRCCPSLKVLAWWENEGYPNNALFELEKFKNEKQTAVKIYLNFSPNVGDEFDDSLWDNFPPYPRKNFIYFGKIMRFMTDNFSFDAFNFKCRAPIIKKAKAL